MKGTLNFDKNWYGKIKSIIRKKVILAIKDKDFWEMYWHQQCRRNFFETYRTRNPQT